MPRLFATSVALLAAGSLPFFSDIARAQAPAPACMICAITCGNVNPAARTLVEEFQGNGCPAVGENFTYSAGVGLVGLCQPVSSSQEVTEVSPCICRNTPCEVRPVQQLVAVDPLPIGGLCQFPATTSVLPAEPIEPINTEPVEPETMIYEPPLEMIPTEPVYIPPSADFIIDSPHLFEPEAEEPVL